MSETSKVSEIPVEEIISLLIDRCNSYADVFKVVEAPLPRCLTYNTGLYCSSTTPYRLDDWFNTFFLIELRKDLRKSSSKPIELQCIKENLDKISIKKLFVKRDKILFLVLQEFTKQMLALHDVLKVEDSAK